MGNQLEITPSITFDKIGNAQDFVTCLNEVFGVIYGTQDKPFDLNSINYYAFHGKARYTSFKILKKNGGFRDINAPIPYLKLIQRCINYILQRQFSPHHTSHGFLVNRSIVTNARKHVGKKFVLNIDLENFFGTITFRRIKTVLALSPFNLKNDKEHLAFLISNLCCDQGVLPQGGPCSPILTNIVCQRLDRKLFQLAKTNRAIYSRYADDITFSSEYAIFTDAFLCQIQTIIRGEGFELNPSKTRIQDFTQRQVVTGVTVNRRANVSRKFIRNIRAILNNYETRGFADTQKKFVDKWAKMDRPAPSFINSVCGQIEFLGMVRGKQDNLYLKYKGKFTDLFDDRPDFDFVENDRVRLQLEKDYSKMKQIKNDSNLTDSDRFIEYCVNAFFQIEELINYYFVTAMTFQKLCSELIRYTTINAGSLKNKTHAGNIEMAYKIYLFENYFYYGKGVYYESVITKIRLVRNEGLHRCNTIIKDEEKLLMEYSALQSRMVNQGYILSKDEKYLEQQAKIIPFLKGCDYRQIKQTIIDVSLKVNWGLKSVDLTINK